MLYPHITSFYITVGYTWQQVFFIHPYPSHLKVDRISSMSKLRRKTISRLFYSLLLLVSLGVILLIILEQDLPNVDTLRDIQMQVPLRIYSADHKLIAEFGEKRRIPVELNQVPKDLINAIIATEDKRFWKHSGVDVIGLARAAVELATTGHKSQGGSTITMQVARNFFLSRKKTYIRKIREILLALKIGHELSKDKILSLYLNKVYLGYRSYGFAAAARVYYGKPLNELTLAQMAVLAGLPKAPSTINPIANPDAARERRGIVLQNMYEQHYITQAQFEDANNAPITAQYHALPIELKAPYVAEMVRNAMVQQYGDAAYTKGLVVITTINSRLQETANQAVRNALLAYTYRHGYRGPITNIGTFDANNQDNVLQHIKNLPTVDGLMPAVITSVEQQSATALMRNGQQATIPWSGIIWAGKALIKGWKAPAPTTAAQVLKIGDVVYLDHIQDTQWKLSQIPQVQGALVSLNPVNGGINAIVGGFDFHYSKFNRAIDAIRQPGSGFKPFVYSAALSQGYTLASIVNDAPIVMSAQNEEGIWRPQNDNLTFAGPTRVRIGLMKSRNLVSIRLLQLVGIPYTVNYIQKFGFDQQSLPANLSLALGAGDLTPMQLASGFAVFANGGYKVTPYFIEKVTDSDDDNKLLFQAQPLQACEDCVDTSDNFNTNNQNQKLAPRVISPQNAYLITSAMQSVIQEGTGRAAKVLGRDDLAGKTGTTNNQRDAWFSGFNSDIVTVCWVGFDQPRSTFEYGSQAALPMWIDFMRQALKGTAEHTMPRPPNLVTVKIDPKTGLRARPGQKNAIFETFRSQYVPTITAPSAAARQNDILTVPTNKPINTPGDAPSVYAQSSTNDNDNNNDAEPNDDGTSQPTPHHASSSADNQTHKVSQNNQPLY